MSAHFGIETCFLRSPPQKNGDLSQPGDTGCGLVNVLAYRLDAGREAAGETSATAENNKSANRGQTPILCRFYGSPGRCG
jgi:hypothetical protein